MDYNYGNNGFNDMTPVDDKKSMATLTLVFGIISILCGGGIFGILAIVFYLMNKNNFSASTGKTAKIGFICAIVGFVVGLIEIVGSTFFYIIIIAASM